MVRTGDVQVRGDRLVLTGEVDALVVETWRAAGAGPHRVARVDATGVTFLAVAGVGLLLEFARRAHPARVVLQVRGRTVVRALELTGTSARFDLEPQD